ncbi:hypothetical protein PCK2_000331 [Pneumocystis canis]|nr:hypothetical protein PCK2_000331 [Pneumocystis canis]
MFTINEEQYSCNLCKKLDPIFRLVARSRYKTHPKSEELFFGILDFSSSPEVFEQLQLTTVPVIMVYPATIGPNALKNSKPRMLNIKDGDISSLWIAQAISQETNQPITIIQFFNYGKLFFYSFLTLLFAVFLKITHSFVFFIIVKKELWLALILLFNSGYMYTRIRNIPFTGYDNNNPVYISRSFSSQYGVESQIVSIFYLILMLTIILLTIVIPKISNKRKQTTTAILLILFQFITFSFLINTFQIKNPGYPFKLLVDKIYFLQNTILIII